MGLRYPPVIAPEASEEVLRQIVLVDLGKRAHDAEVECDIAALLVDQDVARMHVGVEKTVAKHLLEKNLHAVAGEPRDIDALRPQRIDLTDLRADHAL